MKISSKGRYALRVMLDMAVHKDEGYISLKDIAERQNISKNYLDQIMMIFKKDQFFHTTRGYQGGYKLAKLPGEYTVGEILRITEGRIAPVACLSDCGPDCGPECNLTGTCMAMPVWAGLEKVIQDYLDNLTLQDILDKYGPTASEQF